MKHWQTDTEISSCQAHDQSQESEKKKNYVSFWMRQQLKTYLLWLFQHSHSFHNHFQNKSVCKKRKEFCKLDLDKIQKLITCFLNG